jgi:hypothetical protein
MGLYQILTAPGNFKFYAEKSFPNPNAVSTATTFGQKSIGYGDSNQPYIKIPFPGSGKSFNIANGISQLSDTAAALSYFGNLPLEFISAIGGQLSTSFDLSSESSLRYNSKSWGPDFLNRGNGFGFIRTSDDVLRLTKYFTDDKSPSSNLFAAKQNLLSRISPRTEASYGLTYGLGFLNGGAYTPASTILQAGLSIFEGHVFKQGLDPFNTIPGSGIRKYETAIFDNQLADKNYNNNRLVKLSKLSYITVSEIDVENKTGTYNISSDTDHFLSYGGGPGSYLGIGRTKLNYATDNTGKTPSKTVFSKTKVTSTSTTPTPLTWDRKDLSLVSSSNSQDTPTISEDFRAQLLKDASLGQQTFLSISPSYKLDAPNTGNIEKRTNFRGAGARGNRKNYQDGKKDISSGTTAGKVIGPTDLINAFPIYQKDSPSDNEILKDMIDFNIGIYDNDTIGQPNIQLNWMHFRVLLDDFSDSYDADWKAISYMGRAESFYKYSSFKRDISISFTVVAQSKQELLPIYKKLNYLASSLAPSYSTNGFIRGNLSQITLGNWLWQQPGFISSVDLSIPDESPWEINLPLDGKTDEQVKQVPHMVQVKLKFTPIHRFRPEINKLINTPTPSTITQDNITTQNPLYGPQQYISLHDQTINSYDTQPIDSAQINQNNNPNVAQTNQQQNILSS